MRYIFTTFGTATKTVRWWVQWNPRCDRAGSPATRRPCRVKGKKTPHNSTEHKHKTKNPTTVTTGVFLDFFGFFNKWLFFLFFPWGRSNISLMPYIEVLAVLQATRAPPIFQCCKQMVLIRFGPHLPQSCTAFNGSWHQRVEKSLHYMM